MRQRHRSKSNSIRRRKPQIALVQAAEAYDVGALEEILGPDSNDIVSSEDAVADKNRAMAFAAKAKEKMSLDLQKSRSVSILTVGNDNYQMPIPIVKQQGEMVIRYQDRQEEILNRRIGTNELDAIAICRGFVEAQHEYAQEKHDDSKVTQYAQRIISTPGKHDGLAWKEADGTWGGRSVKKSRKRSNKVTRKKINHIMATFSRY